MIDPLSRKRKQQERAAYIQSSGAQVHYTTSPIAVDERETIILIVDNDVTIDTTVPRYINCCIDRGYALTDITYCAGTDRVVGAKFKTQRNKVSLRKAQHAK